MRRFLILMGVLALIAGGGTLAWRDWHAGRLADLAGPSQAPVPGGVMAYQAAGSGPAVLVLHDLQGGWDRAPIYDRLAESFRVIVPSRPGYPGTPLAVGRSASAQAEALAALLDGLDIEQAAVVGVGFGGMAAVELARRHPDRVWALVLQDAVVAHARVPPGNRPDGAWADVRAWLWRIGAEQFPRQALEALFAETTSLGEASVAACAGKVLADPDQQARFAALVTASTPFRIRAPGWANDRAAAAALPVERPDLAAIRVPTLVSAGSVARLVPFARQGRVAAEAIPGAEMFLVEGCGPAFYLGPTAGAVWRRITDFLQAHAPGA